MSIFNDWRYFSWSQQHIAFCHYKPLLLAYSMCRYKIHNKPNKSFTFFLQFYFLLIPFHSCTFLLSLLCYVFFWLRFMWRQTPKGKGKWRKRKRKKERKKSVLRLITFFLHRNRLDYKTLCFFLSCNSNENCVTLI